VSASTRRLARHYAEMAAMLLRRAEYTGGAPGHGRVEQQVAT
jgi:hypothetical protein